MDVTCKHGLKKKDKINTVKEYGGIERFHFFFFF